MVSSLFQFSCYHSAVAEAALPGTVMPSDYLLSERMTGRSSDLVQDNLKVCKYVSKVLITSTEEYTYESDQHFESKCGAILYVYSHSWSSPVLKSNKRSANNAGC